jgi:hypothetical protein
LVGNARGLQPMIDKGRAVESGPGYEIDVDAEGRILVVTGDWSPEAASLVSRGEVDGLTLNYARGYRERSLDFLEDWPLRRLDILARTIKDIEPIYRLSETLQDLSLTTDPRATLDCSRLPRLTGIWVENWGQLRESLPLAHGLKSLRVYGYEERDLLPATDNPELELIKFKQAPRLESLIGIEMLPKLSSVTVVGAKKLTDISSLTGIGPRMRELDLTSCKKINDLAPLSTLTGLVKLNITNCGHLASLAPLTGMKRLESLVISGEIDIDDNDLTPVLGMSRLSMMFIPDLKTYTPSVSEVKQHLGLKE